MSDNDDKKSGGRKPLTLNKTTGAGTVRQSFSHGRSKSVVVEKKRRKIIAPPTPGAKPKAAEDAPKKQTGPSDVERAARALGLSVAEYTKRQQALEKAQAQEAEREAQKKQEAEDRARRAREEKEALDAKKREEEEAKRLAEEAAREKAEGQKAPKPREAAPAAPAAPTPDEIEARAAKGGRTLEDMGGRIKKAKPQVSKPSRSKSEPKRRRGKLTITSALAGDDERQRSLASMRRARQREKERRESGEKTREKVTRDVTIPDAITVQELANRMTERAADVVKYLMKQGTMAKMNDVLDGDTAELIVEDFGHNVNRVSEDDVEEDFIRRDDVDPEDTLKPRAPVVAVMGHVDHGKTSLLDALRSTDVAGGEAGGITQHIGAYQVKVKSGERITFLDTPGHAAFSAMRARGAQVTDIVILVVAADDGIMPQTIEAINHCRAAETPMIIAVNKMDRPDANPQKVLQDLLQHEVVVEAMSGETQAIEVSAKTGQGLDELVEAITLQAEVLDLQANPERKADGVVIESKLEKGRGPVATVLVNRGTLKRGEIVVAGEAWGKVRALVDERNQQRKDALPSEPIEILGLNGTPDPGEQFAVVSSEARAREITEHRERKRRQVATGGVSATASLEQMMARLQEKEVSEVPLVLKADVQGSVEAIIGSLDKLSTDEVKARALHAAVGGISESDIQLAKASEAPVIGFNVRANKQARELAEREGVEIRYYAIIYDLLDDIKDVMEGMLSPEKRETFIGNAEILEVFNITKVGKVAGCRVTEGKVERGAGVRLLRDDVVIHEGELSTLKRFKDEVNEVNGGQECGMGFANYHDLKKGDIIECFRVTEVARTLD